MSANWTSRIRIPLSLLAGASVLLLAGCGGGGSNNNSNSSGSSGNVSNSQAVEVNFGPAGNYTNGLFTSVTICVPGSTTQCQTIPNVEVDTGSEGLRLLSSQVTLSGLPAVTINNNALQECVEYLDGSYTWGAVVSADIKLAGETGSGVPIQLINGTNPPANCASGGGPDDDTVAALGANGILGVGVFEQDCGGGCTVTPSFSPYPYYVCPNGICQTTAVPLQGQLQNPVWTFNSNDYNGLLITLPAIGSSGAAAVQGTMTFGIGTQSDNALGSAQIYTANTCGDISTTYNGVQYADTSTQCTQGSFFDTGSNGLFFLDYATLGIQDCADAPGFYCPNSTQTYSVTNTGYNGTSGPVTLSVANADLLFSANSGLNAAFNNLAGDSGTGPSNDYFDFGMPFFYGRTVFIGIENQTGPGGVVGPYYAY